jgi:ABC-2 type transport system permease protein
VTTGTWAWSVRLGLVRIGLEVRELARDRMAAMFTFTLPLILLVIFGSVFSGHVAPGVRFTQYFAAGMIASGAFYSGFQNLAIGIPMERDSFALKRLRGTPMPAAAYFIGKIGLVVVVYVVQLAVLMTLGALLCGLHPPADAWKWWTFAWVSVLGLTACTLLGVAFSGLVRRSEGAPAIVSPVVVVLQFISGVFFQYDQLPSWMKAVSSVFPLRWMALGMRSVFLPDYFAAHEPGGGWQRPTIALVLGAWAVAGLVVALRSFRWYSEA